MSSSPLKLMVIGAHPDDADYKAGGLAALYRQLGHSVRFVSVTDGSAGHHQICGAPLAERRRAEAMAAGATLGIEYDVWDYSDGRSESTLDARERVIRAIRSYRPDLVLTHRPNDYHPDHRVTSQLVQDAAYLLTVPPICPDAPHLRRDPVIAYLSDEFAHPYPFEPDVVVDIDEVWDAKIGMLHQHSSQFYEWLPYNQQQEHLVPDSEQARWAWLSEAMASQSSRLADRHRITIRSMYGPQRGTELRRIEAFAGCEYGAPLDEESKRRLFPMAP